MDIINNSAMSGSVKKSWHVFQMGESQGTIINWYMLFSNDSFYEFSVINHKTI